MRFALLPIVFLIGCQGCEESETPAGGGGGSGGEGPIVEPIGGGCPANSESCECSPCGVGTCVGGVCQTAQVLVDGIPTVANIVTDGTSLFFTSGGHASTLYFDGKLLSIPVAGGVEPTVLIGGLPQFTAEALALDGDLLVFSSLGTQAGDASDGFVGRVPKTGGVHEVLSASEPYAVQLVVHEGSYYWTASGTWSGDFLDGSVRLSAGGSPAQTLAEPDNRPIRLFVDSTHVYWTSQGTPLASPPDGAVRRRTLEGGPIETLATGLDRASAVLVADGKLYYGLNGFIRVAPVDAPDQVTNFAKIGSIPAMFATDGQDLYWTEASSIGRVARQPLAGGPTTVLAENLNIPHGITLDAANVYFTVRGTGIDDGAVMYIPK